MRANLHLLDDEGAPTAHLEAARKYVQEKAPLKRRPGGVGGAPGPQDGAEDEPDRVWTPETTDEDTDWDKEVPADPEGEFLVTVAEWDSMGRKARKTVVRQARRMRLREEERRQGCGPAAKGWISKEEWDSLSKRRKKAMVKKHVNQSKPWLVKFLAPVWELIKMKQEQMERAQEAAEKLGEWMSNQAYEQDKDGEAAEAELDKLTAELKAAQAPMSFANAPA